MEKIVKITFIYLLVLSRALLCEGIMFKPLTFKVTNETSASFLSLYFFKNN
jgi:hypothetical protein